MKNSPTFEDVEVQRRPLTRDEAHKVLQQINDAPAITGYSLREWTGKHDVFVLVRFASNELIGAVLAHHLFGNWCEIAVVFVDRHHRNNGYGRYLFETSLRTLRHAGKKHLLFFSRPSMEKMARDAGFEIYESEQDFVRTRLRRWLFLNVFYKIQWLSNLYRLRELRRKRREFGSTFTFKIGVLRPA